MFKALVDGEEVNLDPNPETLGWVPLEDRRSLYAGKPIIRCRGCSGPAHMKLLRDDPRRPFMVFAHNPGYGEACKALGYHTDESEEHHDLKSRLAAAARRAGWTADTEVYGERCRADVVATSPSGRSKWVLEAQLASIKLPDVIDRTGRYTNQFGAVTWVHSGHRRWANRHEDVQALRVAEEDLATVIGGVMLDAEAYIKAPPAPIADVVPNILTGKLRYIFGADFGFYRDPAGGTGKPRQGIARPRSSAVHRGDHVKECARPRPGQDGYDVWVDLLESWREWSAAPTSRETAGTLTGACREASPLIGVPAHKVSDVLADGLREGLVDAAVVERLRHRAGAS
ncbi:MAG TPA: hypothetical protein VGW74_06920 [Propionibacteriaceae bacterium]|nr:hypothetical protein [Propionibacteriaceae bacterium]